MNHLKKRYKQLTLFLLILGISIRLLLIALPGFKTDVQTYQAWTIQLNNNGISNFYSPNYFADYFPGYLYFLWFLGKYSNLISTSLIDSNTIFESLIKITTTLFDLATAYLIYVIIKRYHQDWAIWGALIYIYNPALVFESSVWGQTDGVMAFFIILTFYFLLENQKYWWWIIFAALSFIIKPQSIAAFPVMFFSSLKNFPIPRVVLSLALIPLIVILLAIPFFRNNPIFGLYELSQKSITIYPYSTLYAFNLWSYFGFWQKDNQLLWSITYQSWGLILFSITMVIILGKLIWSYYKKCLDDYLIYFAGSLSFISFFLLMTRMHERYLYPFFVFFTVAVFIKKSYLLLTYLIILSLIQFINLWYVYYYYNYVFLDVTMANNIFYQTINNYYTTFSTLNLVIFVIIGLIFLTANEKKSHV